MVLLGFPRDTHGLYAMGTQLRSQTNQMMGLLRFARRTQMECGIVVLLYSQTFVFLCNLLIICPLSKLLHCSNIRIVQRGTKQAIGQRFHVLQAKCPPLLRHFASSMSSALKKNIRIIHSIDFCTPTERGPLDVMESDKGLERVGVLGMAGGGRVRRDCRLDASPLGHVPDCP